MNDELPLIADLQQISNLYSKIIEKKVYQADANYHFDALLIVYRNKGMITRKKIAKLLGVNQSQINAIIYRLHAEGFVYQMPNNTRTAEGYIALTPKGDESVKQVAVEVALLNEKITNGIAEEKLENFFDTLETLKLNVKRELSSLQPVNKAG